MSDLTKRAISAALKQLLRKKRLNKITVSDIANECGINRQTFYYHFRDIYDLVEWTCVEDAEKVLRENRAYDTWQDGFAAIFALAKEDKPFIDNIYHSVQYETLVRYLYRLVHPVLKNLIAEKAKNFAADDEQVEFVADFYKYAFVGLLLDWIDKDMRGDPKTIVDKVDALTQGSAEKYFRACEDAQRR